MAADIATHAKSLGDFPLDPDQGQSWLWTGDGARLLWLSHAAAEALDLPPSADLSGVSHGQSLESFAVELRGLQPDRQPIRVKQVPLSHGRRSELFTCLCRHVPLADGSGFGLLTVAIGAPPRLARAAAQSPRPVEAAPAPAPPPAEAGPPEPAPVAEPDLFDAGPAFDPPAPEAVAPAAAPVAPESSPPPEPPEAAPAWLDTPDERRRPLRFVWQTDADGRFVHLSRELAEAVGPSQAMILGKRFADVAEALAIGDAAPVTAAFAGTETFAAPPVLWPAAGGGWRVPVEIAGVPVREAAAFAGFRGYGIARIERAAGLSPSGAPPVAEPSAPPPDIAPLPPPAAPVELSAPLLVEAAPARVGLTAVEPAPDPADRWSLSPSERNAFREIARALGKSGDDAAAEPPPPAELPVTSDRLPPTSPRQMPAWITRRQQALQQPEESRREAVAPVVPYEAFQARLDRRGREPFQAAAAAIVEKLPTAVLVMQNARPVFVNASFLELAGEKDFASFLASGGFDRFFSPEPAASEGRSRDLYTVRDRRGRSIAVEAQVQAIAWDDAPASLMTFRSVPAPVEKPQGSRDAAAAERDLQAARAELRELRFVLDTATDGVLSLDGAGRILAANRSAEALFGFDQNEIAGERFTVLLEPESHGAALDYFEGLKVDGVATIMNDGREVFGRERHGGRIPLFMTLGRMGGSDAETRFCAVLRDVTIWKKAEAELTEARRAAEDSNANKTEFLARVSHEIRTPMNAIIGFADVMRNETFGPVGNEKYKGYVADIHDSGLHVVSIVNDLLDLSKVASGKLDLTFGSVDLNQSVAAAVSMIQPQANAGKVIVRTQLAPALPPVVADERSVRQIVLNLLSNAAKFTEPGGQVVVTTALTERGEAVIRVRDTGIGMNPEELKRAIEPFRQVSGPRASGGTGLGLPLTKALTEANRASFHLGSEPGKGTLAEVVFPSTRVLAE